MRRRDMRRSVTRGLTVPCVLALWPLLCSSAVHGQGVRGRDISGTLGVATLRDQASLGDTIRIYNADGSLWYQFSFLYDDSDGEWDFPNPDFRPLAFHPDYALLALVVVARSDSTFEVVVDEETGSTKWVASGNQVVVESWEDLLLSVFSIEADAATNPVRVRPDLAAREVRVPESVDGLHPIEIVGDWVRVELIDLDKTEWDQGWLRWRERGHLLVDLFFLS